MPAINLTVSRNNIKNYFVMSLLILSALSMVQNNAFAASAPDLGAANSFGILASTYTNTVAGTSITGDLGYTTGPAVAPTVSGSTYVANGTYSQAGLDQNSAISSANSQTCTSNLGTAIDLSLVNNGTYTPGVYCTTGATSIGTGGITLSGNGVYIFNIASTLGTVDNSHIVLTNGAQTSNVFWVPTGATTLGANSNFTGTILDAAGVTIGSTVTMTGRVLAFGGTVTTDVDTIIVPSTPPTIDAAVPISGPMGQTVSVNFNNLIANHAYTIKFGSTTAGGAFATGTTNSTGGAAGSVTVPSIGSGSQPLSATDGTNSPSTPFTVTSAVTLTSIAITTPATKLSYTVGDALNTTGLVVTGTYSDSSTGIVTPDSITGFDSSAPVTGQVLTVHVGSHTATYTIDVSAGLSVTLAGIDVKIHHPPSLGNDYYHRYSDGLAINYGEGGIGFNGKSFDITKYGSSIPQQALQVGQSANFTFKIYDERGPKTLSHVGMYMHFKGDTTVSNSDTYIVWDKHDGIKVTDPEGFFSDTAVSAHYDDNYAYVSMQFTPAKAMADSSILMRMWDDKLASIDLPIVGAIIILDPNAPVLVKEVPSNQYGDYNTLVNLLDSDGYEIPSILHKIKSGSDLSPVMNVYWIYDKGVDKLVMVQAFKDGTMIGDTVFNLFKKPVEPTLTAQNYYGHVPVQNSQQNPDQGKAAMLQDKIRAMKFLESLHPSTRQAP